MKQFNWEEFKDGNNKIAVHCKTDEEAKDFCKKMHEHGMKWCSGYSYILDTNYKIYEKRTCYTGCGGYSTYAYYINQGYKILEWSDYMKKEFTKADLKNGMVVEYRRGDKLVVFGDKLLSDTNYDSMEGVEEDLTDSKFKCKDFDIVKVYKVNTKHVSQLSDIFKYENLEVIWERNKTKYMTSEEMRQKLEELTDEKIDAKPSRNEMVGALYGYCKKNCTICNIHKDTKLNCNFESYSDDALIHIYNKIMEESANNTN